jgi:hypothetical protein
MPYLQSDKLVVNHHFLGEEVGTDGGLVLTRESLVHILVHQRRLADAVKEERRETGSEKRDRETCTGGKTPENIIIIKTITTRFLSTCTQRKENIAETHPLSPRIIILRRTFFLVAIF